jgi:hypothetical protein
VVAFPLTPVPGAYANITTTKRGNVFVEGEAMPFTFNKNVTGTYTVRDYYGTTVSTGSLTAQSTVTPTAPGGGWKRGWYRLYLTGSSNDALFGFALGSTNFCIVANDPNLTPRPGKNDDPSPNGEVPDLALKGWLGIGTSRIQIANADAPTTGFDNIANAVTCINVSNEYWTTGVDHQGPDPARPRVCYVSFPNEAVDILRVSDRLMVMHKSVAAAAAGSVQVTIAAGTSSGLKYTFVQGATNEVFDNVPNTITAALTTINPASNLVSVFRQNDKAPNETVPTLTATTLPNAKHLGVKQVVQNCYPVGCQWFEGPENEPDIRKNPTRYAHMAKLFHGAVKAGNAGAQVFGPSMVDITQTYFGSDYTEAEFGFDAVYRFLVGATTPTRVALVESIDGANVAAKDYLEGFGFHPYNFCNGDLNIGRDHVRHLEDVLVAAGVEDLPRFQGEQGVLTPVYGVYHPRRARWQMMHHLLLDQMKVPMERNTLWYDKSHGFWSFPGWWINENDGLNPHGLMLRVMAEETYGHAYEEVLDFGTGIGNRIFTGHVYVSAAAGTRRIGFLATSHLDNATVTLALAGAVPATVTWRTALGVETTAAVTDGKITLPVLGEPTWVRLPAGCTATVQTFLGLNNRDAPSLAARNSYGSFDGVGGSQVPVDGLWARTYGGARDGVAQVASNAANYTILLGRSTRVTGVVVFSGMAWQAHAAVFDFDIQTSTNNGSSWTTRATVTKATPSSFLHGSSANDTGCQRETFWDEQWVYPVTLPTPQDCNAVRVVIRNVSYGGEPDAAAIVSMGQGAARAVTLSEVVVLGDPPPLIAGTA